MIRSPTLNRASALLASALMLAPTNVLAGNPPPFQGVAPVAGGATMSRPNAGTLNINQSTQSAIYNSPSLNIYSQQTVNVFQPGSMSSALFRCAGCPTASQIDGALWSNGRVFLVNPSGFLFGSGASINVSGLLATTHDITNANFMAGTYKFDIPGQPNASIVNLGNINITPSSTGFAALVAPGVRNAGVITANLGNVTLAAGNGFTLDFYGDKLITLQVGDEIASRVVDVATGHTLHSLVKNEGTLRANGGQVVLTAAAARHVVDSVINNKGTIEANSVGMKNGMIVLGAATAATKGAGAPKQKVKVSGTLSAAGNDKGETGGVIQITGEVIKLAGATLDVSGHAGGGTVLVGGDTGGGRLNPAVADVAQAQLQPWSVPTASSVSVDAATVINASARGHGDGGKVVVWSNESTIFNGTIKARGGHHGGNGGFAEVASGDRLNYDGSVDLRARHGSTGTLHLNAANVHICNDCWGQTFDPNSLSTALDHANVIVTASGHHHSGNITVEDDVTWNSHNALTLSARRNINVNANITSQHGGAVTLHADNTGRGRGTVTFGGHYVDDEWVPFRVSTSGAVTIFYNPESYAHPDDYSANVAGDGRLTAYMLVNNVDDLQNIQSNLNGTYALGRNIDASATATANWNDGAGFVPLGGGKGFFTGLFNGDGHTIDGLTIAPTALGVNSIGLFANNYGTIENVHLTNVSISANPNASSQTIGALVGTNFGLIRNVTATGTIDGGSTQGIAAGGLVGWNSASERVSYEGDHMVVTVIPGVIAHSSADVSITLGNGRDGVICGGGSYCFAANYAGGLAGINSGVIAHSQATGQVTSGSSSFTGGLVGVNEYISTALYIFNEFSPQIAFQPHIYASSATGDVTGGNGVNGATGGLAGYNVGVIARSFATGAVSGGNNVGGLVGANARRISHSSASGAVSGGNNVGGLVGYNVDTGRVTHSYATNTVSASYNGGGLAGRNDGLVKYSYATGAVSGGTSQENYGLGGLVGYNTGVILQSYATGPVNGVNNVGGLVGWNIGSVSQSYAIGAATGSENVGGLVGSNGGEVTESFASGLVTGTSHVGGLVGINVAMTDDVSSIGQVTTSYWDRETTKQQTSAGSDDTFGLSHAASFQHASYAGWTFGTGGTWFMIDGKTRPFLQSEYSTTITNTHQLQLMAMNLNADYRLATNLAFGTSFSNPSDMWYVTPQGSTQGFVPVGEMGNAFVGTFDGRGHTIDGLKIAPTDPNVVNIGLFGVNAGTIENVRLTNASIAANTSTTAPTQYVGTVAGQNFGLITHVRATGTVDGGDRAGVAAGGLVGQNSVTPVVADEKGPLSEPPPGIPGVIRFASADVAVTVGGGNTCNGPCTAPGWNYAGGLVGINGGVIDHGSARGAVTSGSGSFAGGLVGQNANFSQDTFFTPVITNSFAVGAVSVGASATGGGLVGSNVGVIWRSHAGGIVTGAAGIGSRENPLGNQTTLGGLAGENHGLVGFSYATGDVGGAGVDNLKVGGLVGNNHGTIVRSHASGNVAAGNASAAGGLVGESRSSDQPQNCNGPCPSNAVLISRSYATGTVTVGSQSVAGGLVAINNGAIIRSFSTGDVTAGHDSILGGFVGFADVDSMIRRSSAAGTVTSTGANSIAGGFVGVNGGQIVNSDAFGGVNGTLKSYLGGFAGINAGPIQDSTSSGNVTWTGTGNVAGGFVAASIAMIDPSTSSGSTTTDPNSIVGQFAGGNIAPNGSIDSASGSTSPGTQVASTSVTSGYPSLPSILAGCTSSVCTSLSDIFQPPPSSGPTVDQPAPPNQQVVPPGDPNAGSVLQVNLTSGPTGGGGAGGGSGGSGSGNGFKPNYGPAPGPGLGRTADEQQYSGVPPPNETRFRRGEVVIQVVDTVPVPHVVDTAAGLGLVLISTQHLDNAHRNVFRFRVTGNGDYRKLIVRLEKVNIFASTQPNYNFVTAQAAAAPTPSAPATVPATPPAKTDQTAPPPNEAAPDLANADTAALQSLPAGDAAQYVIDKFHLGAVHRLASGRNVTIAVVDSEIDPAHPDLRGVVIDRFDATQTASKPHAHGTGMAGAIASRFRLLGVAPGVRIIAIKAFDESATSAEATSYQILKGLDYAIAKKVRIINMSFAGPRDPMMERTLKTAHDAGIILIAAAGNAGPKSPPLYPGADPSVIAVSATDFNDRPFTMANRGKYIAVAAPGVDVMVPAPAGGYQLTTGTSVAAAHVSGVAALLVERKPGISPDEVKALLMKTATAFSSKPKGEEDGAGLVDPAGALQALAAAAKTSEVVPGTAKPTVH
jgi:filamentous hemagglutinin family protein